MAKQMGNVYADMRTVELVKLRGQHLVKLWKLQGDNSRKAVEEAERLEHRIDQINDELAYRIAYYGLWV